MDHGGFLPSASTSPRRCAREEEAWSRDARRRLRLAITRLIVSASRATRRPNGSSSHLLRGRDRSRARRLRGIEPLYHRDRVLLRLPAHRRLAGWQLRRRCDVARRALPAGERGRVHFLPDGLCGGCHGGPMLNETTPQLAAFLLASGLVLPAGTRFQDVLVSERNRLGNPPRDFLFKEPGGSTSLTSAGRAARSSTSQRR